MKKKKIFIHIGFPKTGTTYLQNNIFPNIKDAIYLGKPFVDEIKKIEENILKLNDKDYENKKIDLINTVEKVLNQKNSNMYIL